MTLPLLMIPVTPPHGADSPDDSPLVRFLTDPSGFATGLLHTLTSWLGDHAAVLSGIALPSLIGITAAWIALTRRQAAQLSAQARCVTILASPEVAARGGEVLWAQLAGVLRPWWQRLLTGQPHLGFEYAWGSRGLQVHVWVPTGVPTPLVRRAIEAAWPGAHTQVGDPPDPVPLNAEVTAGRLRLARPEILPLRADHPTDPIRALLHAASGLASGEQAYVQVLARPATGRTLRRARAAARRLKAGQNSGRIGQLADYAAHQAQRTAASRADAEHTLAVRHAAAKLTGPLWQVAVAYAASHPADHHQAREQARGRAHSLASAFGLYADRNWLARTRIPRSGTRIATLLAARRMPHRGRLLSTPELAALAHLPYETDAPGLTRAGARSVPPPPAIPTPTAYDTIKPLGRADTSPHRAVGLTPVDARHHVHLLGATGSGKSTLIAGLALHDAAHGRGVVVIDPKGDLVTDILDRLPADCADRLVILDPDDAHPPPCLNVLEGGAPDVVVDNITGIFARIFSAFWGPRTDDIMRAACLTLLASARAAGRPVTLADIPRLLGEPAYRRRVLPLIKDPVLRGFWAWYETLSEPSRAAVIGPVMNKLRAFLLRDFARRAITAGPSTFRLPDILNGGILLARLPKGALGEETSRLLGSFVVAKTWQAAAARARTPEHTRTDASLYIDEAHNYLTLPYPLEDMLAEARGYRLALTLAHQHLAQLPRDLREGISANARNKIYFNASPEDAAALERHTPPTLTAHDLAHLGRYQAAARLLANGAETTAFTLTTHPLPPAIPGRAALLRTAAADRLGTPHATAAPATHPEATTP